MKKQLFKSGKKGILIGLVVSMIMSLIWAPSYMPLNPAEWSLLRATLTHYALTCLGFIPLATLSGWFPLRLTFYLELVIEFSLIYLLVWVFSYWKMKKDIEQLNQELKHL